MSLTNFELENLCSQRKLLHPICVYAEDLLNYHRVPGSYYVNIHHDHWTLLKIFKTHAFFFNSFGEPPPSQVLQFISRLPLEINAIKIQDDKSKHCGLFCLECDYECKSIEGFQKYCHSFEPDTKLNDRIILDRVKRSSFHH
jgi:hypothetical protein